MANCCGKNGQTWLDTCYQNRNWDSELVKEVSKAEFKSKQQYITFEICANDTTDDEDVEVPYVRYKFRGF